MEYQNMKNLLDNTPKQLSKLRRKNWVQINYESRGTYNTNSQIKFKTSMLNPSLFDYSDTYILVSGTIIIIGAGGDDAVKRASEKDKEALLKNFTPFTDCNNEMNNSQVDHTKDIDLVVLIYNLIKGSANYSKPSGSSWQYSRDEANATLAKSESFNFKARKTGSARDINNTKDVKIAVPLKYLSNFWRTLEVLLINCEINLITAWSENCVISSATEKTKFAITDTKLYLQ